MTTENDIAILVKKYNEYLAETIRLKEEDTKKMLRHGEYDRAMQFKDEESFAQSTNDMLRAQVFFLKRESNQRKMLIEIYEKQGIPEAVKVVDEYLSRLNVEARMRHNEMRNAAEKSKQAPEQGAGEKSNKPIPNSWIQWPSKRALADACGIVEKNMDYHIGKKHQLYVKNIREIHGTWYASRDCAIKIKAVTQTKKQTSKSKKDRNK